MQQELSQTEIMRYSRHMLIPEVGLEGQRKLKNSSVLIVGSGGLGSPVALYLAAAGVGRIGLVDYDVVEESNLQRQIIHGTDRVGAPKVDSARQRMLDLNPYIQVDIYNEVLTSQNAEKIAEDYQILVDGTDNFPTRYLINDLAVLTRKPFVYGSIFRFEGQVSVFDARSGPCYRCLFPEPPPPGMTPSCSEGGVFGVLPGTIGTIQATEVIKLALGQGKTLVGKLLLYDAFEMSMQIIQLRKNPHCILCGEQPVITRLIDYEDFCGVPYRGTEETIEGLDHEISPIELSKRLQLGDPVVLIDVRDPIEQQISVLPGAQLIPIEQLPRRVGELDPDKEYVLFCRTGVRSAHGVDVLTSAGFQRVKNLAGGLNGWADQVDPGMLKY